MCAFQRKTSLYYVQLGHKINYLNNFPFFVRFIWTWQNNIIINWFEFVNLYTPALVYCYTRKEMIVKIKNHFCVFFEKFNAMVCVTDADKIIGFWNRAFWAKLWFQKLKFWLKNRNFSLKKLKFWLKNRNFSLKKSKFWFKEVEISVEKILRVKKCKFWLKKVEILVEKIEIWFKKIEIVV